MGTAEKPTTALQDTSLKHMTYNGKPLKMCKGNIHNAKKIFHIYDIKARHPREKNLT